MNQNEKNHTSEAPGDAAPTTPKKRRRKSKGLTASDLLRIPGGVLLAWLSISVVWKFSDLLSKGPVGIIVFVFAILVELIFLAIGFAMAVGPFLELFRRRGKASKRQVKRRN